MCVISYRGTGEMLRSLLLWKHTTKIKSVSFPILAEVYFSAAYPWPLRFQSGVFDSPHFILHLKNKSRAQQTFRVSKSVSNFCAAWQASIFIDNCFIMQSLEFYMASFLFFAIGTLVWNPFELGSETQIRWSTVWYDINVKVCCPCSFAVRSRNVYCPNCFH